MTDKYGRSINYMRVSVTDRCNLRCLYCMPEEGLNLQEHSNILSLEEIARLIKVSTTIGINKIRITGGEPLVRKNIVQLFEYINKIKEIDDKALTTNGIFFAPMSKQLKAAGLQRVNFSLDTLQTERYKHITRGGKLDDVKRAIDSALDLDMHPIKINMVVIKGFNDDEIMDFAHLAYNAPLHVRFIEFMPIGDLLFWEKGRSMSSKEIQQKIEEHYQLIPNKILVGNGPAKYYQISGGKGSIGFISPMSNHFCEACNRIRLTAEGRLRACLYDQEEIDLQEALQNGVSDEEIKELFLKSLKHKPEKHLMDSGWGNDNKRKMYQIGG